MTICLAVDWSGKFEPGIISREVPKIIEKEILNLVIWKVRGYWREILRSNPLKVKC
jgi:transposase